MPEINEINDQNTAEQPEADTVDTAAEQGGDKLQAQLQEQTEKYLRLCAEYDNFRKRSQKEREEVYPIATAAAIAALLPVADNFERAISAECSDEGYKKGTEMTFKSLMEAFEKLGVSAFGEKGDAFDPNLHNAVMTGEEEGAASGTILEVLQKGYQLGERVIRFAMVKVAQ